MISPSLQDFVIYFGCDLFGNIYSNSSLFSLLVNLSNRSKVDAPAEVAFPTVKTLSNFNYNSIWARAFSLSVMKRDGGGVADRRQEAQGFH